ncbi:MAG: MFS transporter [Actinomycetaceae bacterium]|nr:MFS transporter [Actinomycetaceae bacterium]MDU0971128.1 MFS transporter [Actinomycetaceae bacterium]
MSLVPPRRHPYAIISAVALTSFLATFNETFLNVALTPIMADFHIGPGLVQWVTTVYMLAAAIMVPVTGFLSRSVPTHRLLAISLGLLLAGTLIGAWSPVFGVLLAARVVQAAGTGMLVPLGMTITLAVSPRNRIGLSMGLVAAMTTLGPACGPIVAGLLMVAWPWRTLFWVFATMVLVVAIVVLVVIGNIAELTHPAFDLLSVVEIALALLGILFGISQIAQGTPVTAAVALVVGLACGTLFVRRQLRISDPLISLTPLGTPAFRLGMGVFFLSLMTVFSMNIILPLFMQGALGMTAFGAACTLLVPCGLQFFLAPAAGKAFDRWGLRIMTPVGLAAQAICSFALAMLGTQATPLRIALLYTPLIIGCSLSIGPCQSFALASLPRRLHADGVTLVTTGFQIAGCVGSSVFVGVLAAARSSHLAAGASAPAAQAAGFHVAALVAAGVGVVGFTLALVLARQEIRGGRAVEEPTIAGEVADVLEEDDRA